MARTYEWNRDSSKATMREVFDALTGVEDLPSLEDVKVTFETANGLRETFHGLHTPRKGVIRCAGSNWWVCAPSMSGVRVSPYLSSVLFTIPDADAADGEATMYGEVVAGQVTRMVSGTIAEALSSDNGADVVTSVPVDWNDHVDVVPMVSQFVLSNGYRVPAGRLLLVVDGMGASRVFVASEDPQGLVRRRGFRAAWLLRERGVTGD